MKYQSTIDKIRSKTYSRAQLVRMRANAEDKLQQGDKDAKTVLDEIDRTEPTDESIVFMGFCPAATMDNRLDIEWKKNGICTFIFLDSPHQLERFNNIWPGDLIVLKKRHVFGKTMQLYGHGRVTGVQYDTRGDRYLLMNWSSQAEVIEVPLMACNSTVDVKTIEQVEAEMPESFYTWLK
jgi:hypothetical protein